MTRHAMMKLALGGLAAFALGARPALAQPDCASNPDALIIYHAGSLSAEFSAVEKLFTDLLAALA